ncbi:MAG TPA: polysaccharide biosynthesis C-terminal domain-containing protein [Vicinamibacterales bacterium]|nr:polysaccharide biosynthesis C-terminal domain-containing protein [Vicinamibacterales bacterium]
MTTARRSFAWNALALSAAQLASPVLNATFTILLARRAGPEILGRYSLLITAFLVVDQLRLFGLQRLVTRELAAERPGALELYHGFLRIADIAGVAGAAILAAYGLSAGIPAAAVLALAAGLAPSARVWANDAVFLSTGRADYTTRVVVIEGSARSLASIAILWWLDANLTALSVVYAGGRLLAAGVGARYRRRLVGAVPATSSGPASRRLLPYMPDFFAVTALPLLLLRADVLVVGLTAGARDLGLYGAASKLVAIMLLLPDGIMLANFARLSRATDISALRRIVTHLAGLALAVLVPMALAVSLLAGRLTSLVYGAPFADSARYLGWLIWSVPLFVLCRTFGDALVATGHQRRLALVIITTGAASVPLYVWLTGALGPLGAAIAYLGSLSILLAASVSAMKPVRTLVVAPVMRLDGVVSDLPVESR